MVARLNPLTLSQVAQQLKSGLPAIFPTDTVYACGCVATDTNALIKLYQVRQRQDQKPLQVHISDPLELSSIVIQTNELAKKLIAQYWPGPLTLVFNRQPKAFPDIIAPGLDTIAVRCPSNRLERELINLVQQPLVAPSANPPGQPPALTVQEAYLYFGESISAYLDGGHSQTTEVSTIIDVTTEVPKILRKGVLDINLFSF